MIKVEVAENENAIAESFVKLINKLFVDIDIIEV